MIPAQTAPTIALTATELRGVETELLIVPIFENEETPAEIDAAIAGEGTRAQRSRELRGKPYDLFLTLVSDQSWRARRVALLGAGPRERFNTDLARKLAAAVGISARQRRIERIAFVLPGVAGAQGHYNGGADGAEMAQAVSEGLTLAEFDAGQYKTEDHDPGRLTAVQIVLVNGAADGVRAAAAATERGRVLGECSNLARALANEPGNSLTPRVFAERAAELAGTTGVSVEILDERQIADLKMGLLLGVARGSEEPPRVIVLRHDPPGAAKAPVLGLVGKGITFDTGGISIKPADGMERMKDDMAGGAAVVCAMRAIAALGAPIRVVGVVPSTENMPGGAAIKPGDVLTSASGKTVEVINTDAEGRLVLGDGLWYAQRLGATHLIDVATLTGACVVALGKITSGLFGTPPEWVEHVRRVADREGDRSWPMPVFDEYRDQIRSEIADLMNTGGRPAGAITAAMFLKEFTGGLPWVHMDIAGTAWAEEARPYLPKGPSGVAVRTLAELAFSSDSWPER